ncbi:disease resistance protein RPV1-like [Prosopis cineraria]|uniref:disease resistance protein RPV1-like n=1 Tax=Prosopis cineraria TaxID=364024 RepID=UPI00240F5264|nr:disease resistance protein RPV1-like [Prosopis cineraria]XP_054778039.1 disease resistance protein RPV1-like [Prosopis cineraria]
MDATVALMLIEASMIVLGLLISKAIRFISPSVHDCGCKDAAASISTVSSPSHTRVASPATKYDVFLSFRGEDTRDNFTSYLYGALCNANIHTFMDHKLDKGDQISPILLRTIKESKISVIIFSEDYASSTWCMDELIHILECKDKYGRIVVPIFYKVDPSNIRKQSGSFGDGFAKLEQRFKDNQVRLQKWREALIQSTSQSGWDSKNIRPEPKLIKKIVKDILGKLKHKSLGHFEGLVGIDHHIENIEELLSKARIVGIWGMAGAGKTTLAKALFQKLRAKFEASSFVENVRERAKIGLDKLQRKCVKELLKDKEIDTYDIKSSFVKSRLQRKKILLILDDVDNSIMAEDLTKVCDWFGNGSRIIITSRDMQVLKNASASNAYHIPPMNFHDAFHLFSLKAFKQNEPFKTYANLSKSVVDYCQGNPLALVVLGCFLHGRGKKEWESTLEKLKEALHEDIFNVLKLSFDGLGSKQRHVFLDLAFFLSEAWNKISVEDCTRHLYGSSVHIDICVLRERSLISIDDKGYIEMHALVKEMGLEISAQQLMTNAKRPVRLWRHEDIYNFFINNKGTEAIQCISLDVSKIKRITLKASNFQKMYNLIFLKLYKSEEKPSKVNILGDLDNLPEGLKFFCWEECPLPSVPLSICAENLVHLKLPNSNLRQLWDGDQHFPNLQSIDLRESKHLTGLPDLSQAPNLERISASDCSNLGQIHSSVALGKLANVFLQFCGVPTHVNIGGTIKGTSSGFVAAYNYLDLRHYSFNAVKVKLFISDDGSIISGLRFKHVAVPFVKKSKRDNSIGIMIDQMHCTQRLASLLPFVNKVYWSDGPIDFGNFKQHFNHVHANVACFPAEKSKMDVKRVTVRRKAQGGMVMPLRREVASGNEEKELIGEVRCCSNSNTLTALMRNQVVHDYEDQEDELTGEVELCGDRSDNNTLERVLVPKNITRWSLLSKLTLRKRDIIGNEAWRSVPELSILKALAQSGCCRMFEPMIDLTLSLDAPESRWCARKFAVYHSPEWIRGKYEFVSGVAIRILESSVVLVFWDYAMHL